MAQGHSAKFRKVMEGWTAVVSYARWDWQHQQFQEVVPRVRLHVRHRDEEHVFNESIMIH